MDKWYFTPTDERVAYLAALDPKLNKLIHTVGTIEVPLRNNYYQSIVRQIVGQQLSLKAAGTINTRIESIWPELQPELLEKLDDEALRSTGVSRPKIRYIRDLTEKYLSKEVNLEQLDQMENEEVIKMLTSVKGIGQWTAEMFLIFSLGRLDVLSAGDLSIRNAIRWLHQIDKEESLNVDDFYNKWKPYNTIVSLYLWAAIDLGLMKQHPDGLNGYLCP